MTTSQFDGLRTGSRVRLYSRWLGRVVFGTVTRLADDEVEVRWDDGKTMRVLRHQVRIYRTYYEPIEVLT